VAGTLQDQIWRAIQIHHVVLIVLSKDSVRSDWVENELEMARDKENEQNRPVLCPIALDDSWKEKVGAKDGSGDSSRHLWRTLQQKLIIDFSGWDSTAFEEAFRKLVRGLKENYSPR
jgi:TIR domain